LAGEITISFRNACSRKIQAADCFPSTIEFIEYWFE